ncbi:conserved protein of unknown function [Methylacidimicrobium sp. AP8]|uniref:YdcF family protein n=1 Tax=Methylacidimicrobium sp. AP8 TaxID=2730359 RepID=UPI0018C139E7|nr:YdcF family protein [Methylacidimicrobium sp. AP8]CAB4243158.1 conserved protein of unknown function [Methylacidimicrobium sp. AP8]
MRQNALHHRGVAGLLQAIRGLPARLMRNVRSRAGASPTSGFSFDRESGTIGPMARARQGLLQGQGAVRWWRRCRSGNPELGSFFLGADGLSMLALSLAAILASGTLSYWCAFASVLRAARRSRSSANGFSRIVVLGSCLDPFGRPTPTYRRRLERALALFGSAPGSTIFLLGGRTAEGAPTEAEAGADYLRSRGVPESALVREERSRHTLENLRFYRSAPPPADPRPAALVTSRFHLARSSLLACGLGIPHTVCAAEDHWSASCGEIGRLLAEAFLVHWYLVGRTYASWTRNRRMLDRIR